jgi:hypothetical protein
MKSRQAQVGLARKAQLGPNTPMGHVCLTSSPTPGRIQWDPGFGCRGGSVGSSGTRARVPLKEREEILRFGWNSRRVVRVASKQVDDRTFAEVAAMDAGKGAGPRRQGGLVAHLRDRGRSARSSEEQISEGFDGNLRGRGRGAQDRERDQYHGGWS